MRKIFFLFVGLLFFSIGQTHSEKKSGVDLDKKSLSADASKIAKEKKMTSFNINDRFANIDPAEMPALVPTTPEENLYVQNLLNSLLDVFKQKRELQEHDPVFGIGKFHWPKDPKKPTRASISYAADNFKLRSLSVGLRRPTSDSPWCSGGISVQPRNFPVGIFQMNLTRDFFSDLKFQKAYTEDRENESTKKVNVFLYKNTNNNIDLNVRFESRTDVSDVKDQYPASFHAVIIERISTHCVPAASR